jgi:hypothetical protein
MIVELRGGKQLAIRMVELEKGEVGMAIERSRRLNLPSEKGKIEGNLDLCLGCWRDADVDDNRAETR